MKRRTTKQEMKDFTESFKQLEPFEIVDELLPPDTFKQLEEHDFKLLLDYGAPKTPQTWQEKLADMAESASVETLEKSALLARRLLEASPIQANPSKREKLFREHLQMLSEYASG